MKSQKAEKQGAQKEAPRQRREPGRPQPDQARRQDQGRVDEEEQGFEGDEEESDRSPQGGARSMREEYDIWFLFMWLLGLPGLVVLTWSLVSG